MKERIKSILAAVAIALSGIAMTAPVKAATCSSGLSEAQCNKVCSGITDSAQRAAAGCEGVTSDDQLPTHILSIVNVAITVVGIVAVLVIVMAGQRFMTANGDPGKLKQAKDMVLYAIIALVIAVLAFAIVNFVSGAIQSNANTNTH